MRNKPKRIKSKTREQWLKVRTAYPGIGGSDAASVVGESQWKTADDLWREKAGQVTAKDISDDPFVQKGIQMEGALRNLFKADHPELSIKHEPYDIWYQENRPFMFVTLDGRIIDKETKQKGVLEIKTSTPIGKVGWEKWNEQIPRNYYIQLLHECAVMDYDFAVLYSCLYNKDKDKTIREYWFAREDMEEDIQWLIEKETEFWSSIQNRTIPPMTLMF